MPPPGGARQSGSRHADEDGMTMALIWWLVIGWYGGVIALLIIEVIRSRDTAGSTKSDPL